MFSNRVWQMFYVYFFFEEKSIKTTSESRTRNVIEIFKSTYGTCFMCIFLRGIDWYGSQCCQNALGHAHRRRQRQPGRVQQVDSQCFQTECGTCFICIFLLEARLKGS